MGIIHEGNKNRKLFPLHCFIWGDLFSLFRKNSELYWFYFLPNSNSEFMSAVSFVSYTGFPQSGKVREKFIFLESQGKSGNLSFFF